MKATVNRSKFMEAFAMAASVVSVKSTSPALSCVRMKAGAEGVVLMGTDNEIMMTVPVSGCDVLEPGDTLLPTRRMASILAESSESEMVIYGDDDKIAVECGTANFKLPTQSASVYPVGHVANMEDAVVIDSKAMREGLRRTMYACDVAATRYALGGVLVACDAGDTVLSFVATDGRRLARQTAAMQTPAAAGVSFVVPRRVAELIAKMAGSNEPCMVAQHGNWLNVRSGGCEVSAVLLEGRYPNWKQVIPKRSEFISIPVGPLTQSIRQARIVCDAETAGVGFGFSAGNLDLGANTAEVGSSKVSLPIAYDGDAVPLTLNADYVLEALKALPAEGMAEIAIVTASEPVLIKTECGFEGVIMPMDRDR
jgi:DNA polymerase III subunit beta